MGYKRLQPLISRSVCEFSNSSICIISNRSDPAQYWTPGRQKSINVMFRRQSIKVLRPGFQLLPYVKSSENEHACDCFVYLVRWVKEAAMSRREDEILIYNGCCTTLRRMGTKTVGEASVEIKAQ